MFNKYFEKMGDEIAKLSKASKKKGGANAPDLPFDIGKLRDRLENIIPSHLKINASRIIDTNGFSPDGVDLIVYKEIFRDMSQIMDNAVPAELVYGSFFICNMLNRETLIDVLTRITGVKKLFLYAENKSEDQFIPSFVIAMNIDLSLQDLQKEIFDYYTSRNMDNVLEFDIMVVVNKGLAVKDWREKRKKKINSKGFDRPA